MYLTFGIRKFELLSTGSVYLTANVVVALINIGMIPILVSMLSPAEYGRIGIFNLFVSGFTIIVGLDGLSALTRKIYDDRSAIETRVKLTTNFIFLTVFTGIVFLAVVYVFFNSFIGLTGIEIDSNWLWLAALTATCSWIIKTRQTFWQVDAEALKFSALQILNVGAAALLTLLLVTYIWKTADSRVMGISSAAVFFALYCVSSLNRCGYLDLDFLSLSACREILSYSLPLLPHTIGLFLLGSFDRIFVAYYTNLEEFGAYMLATQAGSIIVLFLDGLNTALVPKIFVLLEGSESGIVSYKRLRALIKLSYLFPPIVSIIACSIIYLIFDNNSFKAYGDAMLPSAIIVISVSLLAPIYILTNIALFHNKTADISIITLVSGAVFIVSTVFLTQSFGVVGAALGMFFGYITRLLMLRHNVFSIA